MSSLDNVSATTFFFPGRYSNDTPYSSKSKSQHKIRSEALSIVRVLNFSGRKEEWPTWSEKFLAKAKRSEIKYVFLGKLQLPKTS
jgi:hypothetical protein